MRLSLKAKLTALTSLLVLLVVLATSAVYLSSLAREALAQVAQQGGYVANEVYEQARAVLAQSQLPPGLNPDDSKALLAFVQEKLADDPGLNSLLSSAVTFSPTISYVAITDSRDIVLVHNNPAEIGGPFVPAPPFSDLQQAGRIAQFRAIYGALQNYEITLPMAMQNQTIGDVRVGVSTVFLRSQLTPDLKRGLILAGLGILLATISAGILTFRMLRPLKTISASVEQMARGDFAMPLQLNRKDEWGILSSKLNLLGEQMRGEKAAYMKLKDNLDHLLSNLAEGLLLFDKDDNLVLATPSAGRLLQTSPDEIMHRPVSEVFGGHRPLDRTILEAFRARRNATWHSPAQAQENGPRLAASVEFAEADGSPMGALVTVRDAASREQLETQIDLTARLAALGRITSGIAHEVKNPLNAMVLQLEILKTKLAEQGSAVQPQIEVISQEIRRLDRVVKTFLDFTKPMELHRSEIDLNQLVGEVFTLAEPQARESGVRLVPEPEGAPTHLRADPDLLKQVLLNLVLNGCQAMPSGGELRVRSRTNGHQVEVEVSDQGGGIPPEVRSHIFELFFSTKPGGTGVGLAISYRIIQLHGGTIDVQSQLNQGTTFHISLPR
jgi:signal transduction histidine kinase